MRVKWKKYKLLDGTVKELVQQVGDGSIIKRFEKTPYPKKPDDVVCPHFLELKWANGCIYNCSWCYLKGTFRFWRDKKTGRIPPHIKDMERVKTHCKAFVEQVKEPEILNSGELADSLMSERSRKPFSVFVQEVFDGSPHKVLYLSKGDYVENFLKHDWQENAVLSWTLNEPEVAARWEVGAPDPFRRLDVAEKAADAGYEVRLRIDPLVPVDGWREKYGQLIDELMKRDFEVERITLGTLRGLLSTLSNLTDDSWTKFLDRDSYTSWGYKPNDSVRYDMFRELFDHFDSYGFTRIGLCKDTMEIWEKLGLRFENIKCNCIL